MIIWPIKPCEKLLAGINAHNVRFSLSFMVHVQVHLAECEDLNCPTRLKMKKARAEAEAQIRAEARRAMEEAKRAKIDAAVAAIEAAAMDEAASMAAAAVPPIPAASGRNWMVQVIEPPRLPPERIQKE